MSSERDTRSFATRFSLPEIHWGWLLLLAGALALLIAASAVLGPFIAGFIIAYLLDPLATRLQRLGLPRGLAAALVLFVFVGMIAALVWAAAPIIQAELTQLATALPSLLHDWQPLVARWMRRAGAATTQKAVAADFTQRALAWVSDAAGSIVTQGLALVNLVALVVISPIVAFYLLRDWEPVIAQIDGWWPQRHAATVRALLAEADAALSGFVRGQSLVCLSLAVLYAIGWGLLGLDYAFVLALLAGVLAFVPYLGTLFCALLSLLIAVGQWGFSPVKLGLVAGVFLIVQAIEGSVLTPNLIGNRIGLHPVWVLFAVLAGGEIAGITGVFLAVPVAAVLGVLVRWSMRRYLGSGFYRGQPGA